MDPLAAPIVSRSVSAARLDAGRFRLYDTVFPGGLHLARHYHERPSVTVVLEGHFVQTFPGRAYDCTPGGVLARPPGETHMDAWPSGRARHLIVEVDPATVETGDAVGHAFAEVRHATDPAALSCARLVVREMAEPDDATPLAAEGLAIQLIARLLRIPPPEAGGDPPPWLRRVRDRLRDGHRRPLALADLAADAGVDPAHLSRAFTAHFGVSPGEYLRASRVAEARRLLLETRAPLARIAAHTGFSDQSHMTRVFRRHTGLTPARFRELHARAERRRDEV